MNILVSGGAGFIGSNFLQLVVPKHPEHRFINFDKLTYAANLLSTQELAEQDNYVFVCGDICSLEDLGQLFDHYAPDAVIHFAAESHVDRSIVSPDAFVQTNIVGTFRLLEACKARWRTGTHVFHHVSTDEVYGSLGQSGRFVESDRYDPSSPYAASKAASDHLVRAYGRTHKLPIKITNCSNNYGPRQFPEKLIPLTILNALERRPLPVYGRGENVRDWLYVDDHCDAIWTVFSSGAVGETYNVGGNQEKTNLDVVRLICRLVAEETGGSLEDLLRLIAFVEDRPGHDLRYAIDATKIMSELGWVPKETFETGLRRTVRWYLHNHLWVDSIRTGEYARWVSENYGQRSTHSSEGST